MLLTHLLTFFLLVKVLSVYYDRLVIFKLNVQCSLCGRVTSDFFKYKLKLKLRYLIRCEKGICFA